MEGDRRSSPRVSLSGDAIVFLGSERIACKAIDVCAAGMGLSSPIETSPGQFVRVNFHLQGSSRMLDADAILVRDESRDSDHVWGVQFQGLSPTLSTRLSDYVTNGPRDSAPHMAARPQPPPKPARPAASDAGPPPPTRRTAHATTTPRDLVTPVRPAKRARPAKPEPEAKPSEERERARAAEPPPPARPTAHKARASEPPPPSRITSSPKPDKPKRRPSAKERHRDRMAAAAAQRELASLYRDAVKDMKDKKK